MYVYTKIKLKKNWGAFDDNSLNSCAQENDFNAEIF